MSKFPMMTKKDADELVEMHKELLKNSKNGPMERAILDSAMVQTLARAVHENAATPELVAYIIGNLFDEQAAEDVERYKVSPTLAALEILARTMFEQEEE